MKRFIFEDFTKLVKNPVGGGGTTCGATPEGVGEIFKVFVEVVKDAIPLDFGEIYNVLEGLTCVALPEELGVVYNALVEVTCGAEGTFPLGVGDTYNTLVKVTCGIAVFWRFECCCKCKRSNPANNKTSLCKGGLRWVFYLSLRNGFGNIFGLPSILRNLNITPHPNPLPQGAREKRAAFTLAEVLITLGIIGIVAALTIPTLIQNYRNHVVETRLQKFYSSINQAIRMAEIEYGDRTLWFIGGSTGQKVTKEWVDTYFVPYLNVVDKKYLSNNLFYTIYLTDGSAFFVTNAYIRDWYFFPGDPEKCINKHSLVQSVGKCSFLFYYNPTLPHHHEFELYDNSWDGTENNLKYHTQFGCYNDGRAYCGKLIQYNGWKIPKDYPYKVSY